MKIGYKTINYIFIVLYLVPVALSWVLVNNRIEQRQETIQLYLKNQVDIDRQIITQRGILMTIQWPIRSFLLKENNQNDRVGILAETKDKFSKLEKFWKKYETNYTAKDRPFLKDILSKTEESRLTEEELLILGEIQRKMNIYKSSILTYLALSNGDSLAVQRHIEFLEKLDREREEIYMSLDELADIRYIFSQRVIFYISGENDRQYGFFSTLFAFIFASILLLQILEYFYISKPFKDIILFLRDMSQGKKGQRLYFSSPIREIKESEEVINEIVRKTEEHEKEK